MTINKVPLQFTKKFVFLSLSTLFVFSSSSFAATPMFGDFTVRAGVNITNHFDDLPQVNDSKEKGTGGEIAAEYMFSTKSFILSSQMGIGIAYQLHPQVEGKPIGVAGAEGEKTRYFNSIPIYLTLKYNIPIIPTKASIYAKGNLGYSINQKVDDLKWNSLTNKTTKTKVDNGLYAAAGLGVNYGNLGFDLMYQLNTSKMKVDTDNLKMESDIDFSRLTFGINYTF